MKPRLLDLFCGAGGCSVGYARAGFEVVGVDIQPQKNYPFAFRQADALEFLAKHGREFDTIHASPPCQCYTILKSVCPGRTYPDLVAATRKGLILSGKPWVIENVPGAPLINPVMLCASMFPGHRVYRHRLFESSDPIIAPPHPKHAIPVNRKRVNRRLQWDAGLHVSVVGDIGSYVGKEAMGIDWMTGRELSQSIPPAYTEFIGKWLMIAVEHEARIRRKSRSI